MQHAAINAISESSQRNSFRSLSSVDTIASIPTPSSYVGANSGSVTRAERDRRRNKGKLDSSKAAVAHYTDGSISKVSTWTLQHEVQEAKQRPRFGYPQMAKNKWTEHNQQSGVAVPQPAAPSPRKSSDLQFCRDKVFSTQNLPVEQGVLDRTCNDPAAMRFNVCHDLVDFTGLSMEEVMERMARIKHYHFEEEHFFWDPQSKTELAWYYSTSQSYLFANAVHAARTHALSFLKKDVHEPVLDYSGGVGNSVLYLAIEKGTKCQYFGIGMMEKTFAQFRVAKRGLQDMITFLDPWTAATNWTFDPKEAPLPRDGSLGSILATDVLEHIPDYHKVVEAMVDSLKVGGVIIEVSPFNPNPLSKNDENDLRIHVSDGGVSMKQAMGERMVFREQQKYWEKIKA